ncbi:MAG: hypothetical protein AB8B79_19090 [Granulosicoccus sp.]
MCHDFIADASFWQHLFELDQLIADEVRNKGCPYCGDVLHAAPYPRKPRGVACAELGEHYQSRLSFCCQRDGCRKRCTPPSVRFMGRKVYLGVVITLICALEQGLTPRRRARLVDELDLWPQTFARWQRWWRTHVPATRHWLSLRAHLMPMTDIGTLPDILIGQLSGENLSNRVIQFAQLMMPLSTTSCSHTLSLDRIPQKM